MKYFNKEEYTELIIEHPNFISDNEKKLLLPNLIQSFAVIEIYLTSRRQVTIESQYAPIRYGIFCGCRISLGDPMLCGNTIDLNPKFIWANNQWMLSTHGYVLFHEIELNHGST